MFDEVQGWDWEGDCLIEGFFLLEEHAKAGVIEICKISRMTDSFFLRILHATGKNLATFSRLMHMTWVFPAPPKKLNNTFFPRSKVLKPRSGKVTDYTVRSVTTTIPIPSRFLTSMTIAVAIMSLSSTSTILTYPTCTS
jgi:hypothetical protein